MTDVKLTIGLRKWVPAAVFVGWVIWYSLPFSKWRDTFADWYGSAVARAGIWVR